MSTHRLGDGALRLHIPVLDALGLERAAGGIDGAGLGPVQIAALESRAR